jgi:hypothetical protein
VIDTTGHSDVSDVKSKWVGWDGSFNLFKTFSLGDWIGTSGYFPLGRTGGGNMILKPYPVYVLQATSSIPTLTLPTTGLSAGRGIDPGRGRSNLTPFTFSVVYTDPNNSSPGDVTLHVKNTTTSTTLSDVSLQKNASGGNYIYSSIYDVGEYEYYFTSGSDLRAPVTGALRFGVVPSTYTYIPKFTFGAGNGDGNDWQIWSFNGSNVYDWSDTYINHYLHEKFKIQAYGGGFYCSQCLQLGVFNHDPKKGFETSDVILSSLTSNPQNAGRNITYDVDMQWDSTGYTYTISHDAIVDYTGHTDVTAIAGDTWVGWDGSFNSFKKFPSGDWTGTSGYYPLGRTGGANMILKPYLVYDLNAVSSDPIPPPTPDPIPTIVPDTTALSLATYTLNGTASDVTTNPLINHVSMKFTVSQNVNWVSFKIENRNDLTKFKTLQSGVNCVDGTTTCAKVWDGALSSGGLLTDGTYRIKVHIKDLAGNEYNDYLPSGITVVQ